MPVALFLFVIESTLESETPIDVQSFDYFSAANGIVNIWACLQSSHKYKSDQGMTMVNEKSKKLFCKVDQY